MSAPFKIVKNAGTWWPVSWAEPLDGGDVASWRIEVKFRREPWSAFEELFALAGLAFCQRVALDWRGITDDADRPAPLWANPDAPAAERLGSDALAEMLSRPAFTEALGATYLAFLRAVPETRQGNSAASPAGGPAAGGSTGAPPAGSTS